MLSRIRYGDTSIIVRVYTEALGLRSYIVRGAYGKSSRLSVAHFQALNLLDMVVYHKEAGGLQHVKEAKCCFFAVYQNNVSKAAVVLFITELLVKVVRSKNVLLFAFLWERTKVLHLLQERPDCFLFDFLLRLCGFLGFGISSGQSLNHQLRRCVLGKPLSSEERQIMNQWLHSERSVVPDKDTLKRLICAIIAFYRLHIDACYHLNSAELLPMVYT